MLRIRRISTKLLLAVVAAVLVPFVGFAVFVDQQMAQRLSKQVVLYTLRGLAEDLADRIDRDLGERNLDIQLWTGLESTRAALGEQSVEGSLGTAVDPSTRARAVAEWSAGAAAPLGSDRRFAQVAFFDDCVALKQVYDLMLLVDAAGRLVAVNGFWPAGDGAGLGAPIDVGVLDELFARDYTQYEWWRLCMAGQLTNVGRQVTDLVPLYDESPGVHPENFHLGFGGPVVLPEEPNEVVGVLYALVNWRHVQERVREPLLVNVFQGLVGPEARTSAYAWVWDSDADTIIAHPKVELHGQRVSTDVGLPQLVEAARSADRGLYPEYTFGGKRKNAAFWRALGPEQGGFGWVVGVGIDNDDIFKVVDELRALLLKATLLVVGVALLWTMVIARRATSPILALKAHTQRVAAGDLDARIRVESDDELGELARDFNRMTTDLKRTTEQLVAAEKDAAWREMARQVAHDIKNPLTPIKLSVDLMRRAKSEHSPEFDSIFERTSETILRQVDHLREIASDFHALTGTPAANPEEVDLGALVAEVLELNAAWAQEQGVAVSVEGRAGTVVADRGLLRRVLLNVFSNALQAMPDGGQLCVRERAEADRTVLEIEDSGEGISEEVRPHLFEPYFTTKSHGTGLGLAIAKRVLAEMGGTIELEPGSGDDGPAGTVCRIRLPRRT